MKRRLVYIKDGDIKITNLALREGWEIKQMVPCGTYCYVYMTKQDDEVPQTDKETN